MTSLRTIPLMLCVAALLAFGWAMTCFFRQPSGGTRHTRTVAILGSGFAAWHVWAIAGSAAAGWRSLAAIGLYGVSIGLFVWAVRTCRLRPLTAIFETDVPHHLIQEGPYRYVRHPFYTAYTLFWIAGWVASGSWVALLSVIVMAATYGLAAAKEEAKFHASLLASRHVDYRRRTGFMVPGLGCVRRLRR